ncbi:hypothetical protein [Photobacterium arenosum]|uniref:hypothetical protein n=1 Tax=Photobacterium arenosum TaxID=2774143 RepID=UPI00177A7647|nr:hypothetical protein [Photobacterium arenosum]
MSWVECSLVMTGIGCRVSVKLAGLVLVSVCFVSPATHAAWHTTTSIGGHDTWVPEADSDTPGGNLGLGLFYSNADSLAGQASIIAYYDNDSDHLDPDHDPFWTMAGGLLSQPLVNLDDSGITLGWQTGVSWLQNTVFGVEEALQAQLGIVVNYQRQADAVGLALGAGYYGLEFDDDVPETRGYSREALKRSSDALAWKLFFRRSLKNTFSWEGYWQQWRDQDNWLENQLSLAIHYPILHPVMNSLNVSVSYTRYNLTPYRVQGKAPILPWDENVLFRLYTEIPLNW